MAKRLALVIPTYGRSETVAKSLNEIVEVADALGIEIYYSDDTLDNSVELAVRDVSSRYGNVHYRRNSPSLGHDRNIVESLIWADSDYVWMIGDSLRPKIDDLGNILLFLKGQDFIFLNRIVEEGVNLVNIDGDNARGFVRDKLWNQTLTGATIYGTRVRDWLRHSDINILRNFPHLSVILEFVSEQPTCIGWISKSVIDYSHKPSSYWEDSALDVFVDDWVRVVETYPNIVTQCELVATLKSHSINTKVFSLKRLMSLRSKNRLNRASLLRPQFLNVMHLNPLVIHALARMPRFLARYILQAEGFIHRRPR